MHARTWALLDSFTTAAGIWKTTSGRHVTEETHITVAILAITTTPTSMPLRSSYISSRRHTKIQPRALTWLDLEQDLLLVLAMKNITWNGFYLLSARSNCRGYSLAPACCSARLSSQCFDSLLQGELLLMLFVCLPVIFCTFLILSLKISLSLFLLLFISLSLSLSLSHSLTFHHFVFLIVPCLCRSYAFVLWGLYLAFMVLSVLNEVKIVKFHFHWPLCVKKREPIFVSDMKLPFKSRISHPSWFLYCLDHDTTNLISAFGNWNIHDRSRKIFLVCVNQFCWPPKYWACFDWETSSSNLEQFHSKILFSANIGIWSILVKFVKYLPIFMDIIFSHANLYSHVHQCRLCIWMYRHKHYIWLRLRPLSSTIICHIQKKKKKKILCLRTHVCWTQ